MVWIQSVGTQKQQNIRSSNQKRIDYKHTVWLEGKTETKTYQQQQRKRFHLFVSSTKMIIIITFHDTYYCYSSVVYFTFEIVVVAGILTFHLKALYVFSSLNFVHTHTQTNKQIHTKNGLQSPHTVERISRSTE